MEFSFPTKMGAILLGLQEPKFSPTSGLGTKQIGNWRFKTFHSFGGSKDKVCQSLLAYAKFNQHFYCIFLRFVSQHWRYIDLQSQLFSKAAGKLYETQKQACQWMVFDCTCTWLVSETHAIELVQAGMQANQFASMIDCAGNNKFYQKLCWQKFLFFWRLKKDLSLNFCVYHKKSKIMNWTKHSVTTIYI